MVISVLDGAPMATSDVVSANAQVASEPSSPTAVVSANIAVRWRDLDAYNHVNNSTYLTYLEEARLQWLKDVPGKWFTDRCAPVLAASELNYRAPIEWPAEVLVKLFVERLGSSSITIGHHMFAGKPQRLCCDGRVVLVWMDPTTGKPVPLPDAIREAVAAAEPG